MKKHQRKKCERELEPLCNSKREDYLHVYLFLVRCFILSISFLVDKPQSLASVEQIT